MDSAGCDGRGPRHRDRRAGLQHGRPPGSTPRPRDQAGVFGYTVVEPVSVLATHLPEWSGKHADELLTRDATKHLIEELKKDVAGGGRRTDSRPDEAGRRAADSANAAPRAGADPPVGADLGKPRGVRPAQRSRAADRIRASSPARALCTRYRDKENRLFVVTLDPALEDRIRAGIEHNDRGLFIRMSPRRSTSPVGRSRPRSKNCRGPSPPGGAGVPQIRAGLKQLTSAHLPRLVVLSYNEMTRMQIESIGS